MKLFEVVAVNGKEKEAIEINAESESQAKSKAMEAFFYDGGWAITSIKIKNRIGKDLLRPSLVGVGYIGHGPYKVSIGGKITKSYSIWAAMLNRSYNTKTQKRQPTYTECSVDPYWHNYQNFAKWLDDNYTKGYHLDKDILHQGNKIYSADNCIFVHQGINKLLTDHGAARGNCKIGVHWCVRDKRYIARCNVNGERVIVGSFSTENEAHEEYKKYKYKIIKEVASIQSEPLRSALIKYKIGD